ncbi:hypothetical protein J2TS4_21090 [Paenibacillus sp. J2TS4]|nr:hypothetical protein J2TS4_21090 [Paenibacillus sp. J2TS4]
MKRMWSVCWIGLLAASFLLPATGLSAQNDRIGINAESHFSEATTIIEPIGSETVRVNQLENASFEVPPAATGTIPGWKPKDTSGSVSFELSRSEGTFLDGKQSLHIQGSNEDEPARLYSKPIQVVPGQLVKASGQFLVREGSIELAIHAYAGPDELAASLKSNTLGITGEGWSEEQLTMTVPEEASWIRITLGTISGEPADAFADALDVDAGVTLEMKDWGPPIETVSGSRAVFAEENGRNIMYMNLNGSSAQLAKVDLDTLTLVDQVALPDTMLRGLALGADGNVYMVGYTTGKLLKYDVQSSTIEELTVVMAGHNVFDLVSTPDGKLYGGTYSRLEHDYGRAFEYDIYTGTFKDMGVVMNGMKYIHSVAYDEVNDAVYFGLATDANIRKYDRKQQQWSGDFIPLLYEDKNFTDLYKYTFDLDAIDGLVYARLSQLKIAGAGTSVVDLVLDPARDDQIIGTFPNNQAREISPTRDGKVYFQYYTKYDGENGNWLAYYDLEDQEVHLVLTPEPVRMDGRFNEFDILQLDRDGYPGDTFVGLSAEGALFTYNFETGKTESILLPVIAEAGTIHATGRGNDGTIYFSGYTTTGYAVFRPSEQKLTQYTSRTIGANNSLYQGEMFIPYQEDQVFIPVYPGVIMYRYDPNKPWNLEDPSQMINPVKLFGLDQAGPDKQERAYAGEVITRNGRETLVTVTTPARDTRTGELVFYDLTTKDLERYKPIENQSIVSMAYKDGIVYGGSSVWNSYGDTGPNEPEAKMFVWDVAANRKIKEFVPVPGKGAITKLIVGPDGYIWGFADGHLFIYDTEKGEVVYNEPKFDITYSSIVFRDAFLEISPDGNVYGTISGRFFMIEPETKNVYLIQPKGRRYLTQDNQGNLFMMGENQQFLQASNDLSSSADLINVKVNHEFIEGFDPQQMEYSIELEGSSGEFPLLEPIAKSGDAATVTVTKADSLPGTAEIRVQSAGGLNEKLYILHFTLASQPITLDSIAWQLEQYISSGDVVEPLTNQLRNSLKQAEHHGDKGHTKQALKSLDDFLKHMNNPAHEDKISEAAKNKLNADVQALISSME